MRNDKLIFDVGLHKGEDTTFYLEKGFRVVAFEANPDLIAHCRSRFHDKIIAGDLVIVPGAISREKGPIKFFPNEANSVWGTTSANITTWRDGFTRPEIEIDSVDISESFRKFGTPHYLKVDIEGADGIVLDQLEQLRPPPSFISFETSISNLKEMYTRLFHLRKIGYKKFKIVQQSKIPGSILQTKTVCDSPFEYRFEEHSSGAFGSDLDGWHGFIFCLIKYFSIYLRAIIFGDHTPIKKIKGVRRILRYVRPQWYDTHASL
jgi:FkbM family methyltransferase